MLSLVGRSKSQNDKQNNTIVSPKSEDLTASKKAVASENAAKRKVQEEERERERKKKAEEEQKIKQAKIDEIKRRQQEEKNQLESGLSLHEVEQHRQEKEHEQEIEAHRLHKIQELEREKAIHSAKSSEEPVAVKHNVESHPTVQIGESDEDILKREEERLNRALKKKELSLIESKKFGKK